MSLFLTQQAGGRLALAITILIVGAAVLSVAPQVVEAGDSHTETVGMTIPDGLAGQGVTSTITVSLAGSVDVDGPILLDTLLVTVNITHEYPGDLDIVLLPPYVAWPVPGFYHPSLIPDGAVQLFARDQTLADGENFTNTRFTGSDDSIHKGSSISAASAPYTGTYLPASAGQQAMNDLYGLPPIGTWTIIVMDTDAGDSGTFDSWAITFSDAQEIDVKDPSSSSLTDGDSVDLGIYDTGTANDSTWTIKNTTATSDLTVENIEFRNATNCEASLSRTSFTVAGAASETFTLTVTPDDNGAFSGRLRITSDDPDEEDFDVYISGIAWFPDGDAPDEPLVVGSSDSGGGGFTDPAEAISALGTLGAAGRIDGPVELELAGGTYSSSLELSGISGIDASHPLTISAADGESVVFTGGDSIAGTLFGTSTTALRISNQSYVNIIGIEFDGGGTVENGVLIEASNSNQTQSITIKGCKFHGYTNCALLVYDANIGSNAAGYLVANNTLWDNECSSGWGSVAIVYAGGGDIVHNTLVHNHASYAWYITAIFSAGIIDTFSNNITYIENATAAVHLEDTITESFPTAMDHNVWHLDGHKLGQDSDNDTLAEWQTDSGK
ncbi:MAG: choice-of-anchor D domain-containing protein, partial [Planctomycetota bacterium]